MPYLRAPMYYSLFLRWRLVVHGGIDEYSRLVVFLRCSSNNRAATVANLLLGATTEFCWPSRMRTDKGGENSEVARLLVEKRGEGRGIILQSSSVHSQRIERLWRDIRKMVLYTDCTKCFESKRLLTKGHLHQMTWILTNPGQACLTQD